MAKKWLLHPNTHTHTHTHAHWHFLGWRAPSHVGRRHSKTFPADYRKGKLKKGSRRKRKTLYLKLSSSLLRYALHLRCKGLLPGPMLNCWKSCWCDIKTLPGPVSLHCPCLAKPHHLSLNYHHSLLNGVSLLLSLYSSIFSMQKNIDACDLMDFSTPGSSVLQCLLEFAQTHVHRVGDHLILCHPLLLLP